MRSLLVECTWGILRRRNPNSQPLEQWALRIAARRGKRIAAVALARKLAGVLYAMTKHQRPFEPERLRHAICSIFQSSLNVVPTPKSAWNLRTFSRPTMSGNGTLS